MGVRVDLGKYVMYDAIASGGMASVHLGRIRGPRGFARTIAIKRLHPELGRDAELYDAFAAEARLAARIRHPNVVSVLDVVVEADELYLVMEFVSAVPLSTLVKRARESGRRIPANVAVAITCAVLRGLDAAHELEVVHRDVSPQNVLVGADGVPRIVDFGIAKVESRATRGKALKGKPSYMAPEQLRGDSGDRRADVHAASVVLWELLTGSRLFGGDNDHAVMLKVLEKIVDAPSRIVPELPEALDAIVLRGLAREPAERFATAREMAEALEQAVPAAGAGETGSFVAELCSADLESLGQRAAAVEGLTDDVPAGPRRRRLGVIAGAALLLAVSGAAIAVLSSRDPARAEPTPAPPSSPPAPRSAPAAPGSAVAARAEPRATPTASATAPAPRVRKTPAAASSTAEDRPKPQPDCDPPYVIDAEGFQRMKPECL